MKNEIPDLDNQTSKSNQTVQSTRIWVLLIVLPWAALLTAAFIQVISHFILNSINGSKPSPITALINIASIFVGCVSVLGIILIPVWIVMLIKTQKNNKAAGASEVSNSQVDVPKSKVVALILAVIFGFWTWLYTFDYEADRKKFWINLVLTVITLGFWGIIAWVWAIIYTSTKPDEYYTLYPSYQVQK